MAQEQRFRFRDGNWSREGIRPRSPWAGEAALILLSSAGVAAMITLLRVYNGRSVFDWNGVTLNAIIAVISVIVKASITSVVSSCLGQWKWIIFSKDSLSIIDFEKIDNASRGTWGSLKVLTRKELS